MERIHQINRKSGAVTCVPARLTSESVAAVLGFQKDDIQILVRNKLLKPLGNPKLNATKYFSLEDVLDKASDRKWLERSTQKIYEHWQGKNLRKAVNKDVG